MPLRSPEKLMREDERIEVVSIFSHPMNNNEKNKLNKEHPIWKSNKDQLPTMGFIPKLSKELPFTTNY